MIRFIKIFVLIVILAFCSPNVNAEETNFGTDGLYDAVDKEGKDILDEIEIKNVEDTFEISFANIYDSLSNLVRDKYINPVKCLFLALVVVVLVSFIIGIKEEVSTLCELSGALTICIIYMPYISNIISMSSGIIDSINVFIFASLPIYSVLHVAVGNPTLGGTVSATVIFTANIFTAISKYVIVPCLSIFLGLSVSSAFSHLKIKSICETIYNFVKWIFVLSITIFSSVISVQSTLCQATDVVSTKTVKLLASNAVPIVGKAFGDGVVAVQNSIKLLKSGAGAFGIIASVCIFLSPVIEILLWLGSCQLVIIVADLFEYKKVKDILTVLNIVLKLVLAVIISLCIVSIVTSAVTLFFGV